MAYPVSIPEGAIEGGTLLRVLAGYRGRVSIPEGAIEGLPAGAFAQKHLEFQYPKVRLKAGIGRKDERTA